MRPVVGATRFIHLCRQLLPNPAMAVIQIAKADRGHEDGESPAKRHRHQLPPQGNEDIDEQHVVAHEKADDPLINKARIGVEQRIDDCDGHQSERKRM